jgi:hemerythrin-like domain-containing protein
LTVAGLGGESHVPSSIQHNVDSLTRVHLALRRGLEAIERGPEEGVDLQAWGGLVDAFARFLIAHHEGEDQFVFPWLRRVVAARPGDPALADIPGFVDAKGEEHETVHELCDRLVGAARAVCAGGPPADVIKTARELAPLLLPHLDEEEAVLTVERLERFVDARDLEKMTDEMIAAERRKAGARGLMYFVHSLTAEEQRAHFATLPWLVRKVLVRSLWRWQHRSMIALTYNPTCAL